MKIFPTSGAKLNFFGTVASLALVLSVVSIISNISVSTTRLTVNQFPPCSFYTLGQTEIWYDKQSQTYDTLEYAPWRLFVSEKEGNEFMRRETEDFKKDSSDLWEPVEIKFKKNCNDDMGY